MNPSLALKFLYLLLFVFIQKSKQYPVEFNAERRELNEEQVEDNRLQQQCIERNDDDGCTPESIHRRCCPGFICVTSECNKNICGKCVSDIIALSDEKTIKSTSPLNVSNNSFNGMTKSLNKNAFEPKINDSRMNYNLIADHLWYNALTSHESARIGIMQTPIPATTSASLIINEPQNSEPISTSLPSVPRTIVTLITIRTSSILQTIPSFINTESSLPPASKITVTPITTRASSITELNLPSISTMRSTPIIISVPSTTPTTPSFINTEANLPPVSTMRVTTVEPITNKASSTLPSILSNIHSESNLPSASTMRMTVTPITIRENSILTMPSGINTESSLPSSSIMTVTPITTRIYPTLPTTASNIHTEPDLLSVSKTTSQRPSSLPAMLSSINTELNLPSVSTVRMTTVTPITHEASLTLPTISSNINYTESRLPVVSTIRMTTITPKTTGASPTPPIMLSSINSSHNIPLVSATTVTPITIREPSTLTTMPSIIHTEVSFPSGSLMTATPITTRAPSNLPTMSPFINTESSLSPIPTMRMTTVTPITMREPSTLTTPSIINTEPNLPSASMMTITPITIGIHTTLPTMLSSINYAESSVTPVPALITPSFMMTPGIQLVFPVMPLNINNAQLNIKPYVEWQHGPCFLYQPLKQYLSIQPQQPNTLQSVQSMNALICEPQPPKQQIQQPLGWQLQQPLGWQLQQLQQSSFWPKKQIQEMQAWQQQQLQKPEDWQQKDGQQKEGQQLKTWQPKQTHWRHPQKSASHLWQQTNAYWPQSPLQSWTRPPANVYLVSQSFLFS